MTDVPVRGYERRGRRVRPHRRGRPLRITVATRTSKAIPHADPRTDGEMNEHKASSALDRRYTGGHLYVPEDTEMFGYTSQHERDRRLLRAIREHREVM